MAFDWMQAKVGQAVRDRAPERAVEGQRREVRDRARLLMHLGYPQKYVAARCRGVIEWEHELGPGTPVLDEVDSIVREVYKRK